MAEPVPVGSPKSKTLQYTWRGLKMVGEKSLFDLKEPVWHADEKSPRCDKCGSEFTFTHRRHHCRRCGDVVCADCCERSTLARMGYVDPVLVCSKCAPICKAEEEFFHNHLKSLVAGAYFHLSDSPMPGDAYCCQLSVDHKQVVISDDHQPISMKHILEVKTIAGDGGGGAVGVASTEGKKRSGSTSKNISLELVYRSGGLEQKLTLSPSTSHSRKQSVEWLRALKKALLILHKGEGVAT